MKDKEHFVYEKTIEKGALFIKEIGRCSLNRNSGHIG